MGMMDYCTIHKLPIYITRTRRDKLYEMAREALPHLDLLKDGIDRYYAKLDNFAMRHLEEVFKKEGSSFVAEWVEFSSDTDSFDIINDLDGLIRSFVDYHRLDGAGGISVLGGNTMRVEIKRLLRESFSVDVSYDIYDIDKVVGRLDNFEVVGKTSDNGARKTVLRFAERHIKFDFNYTGSDFW